MRNKYGAEVSDAPADGKTYGRKDGNWAEIDALPAPDGEVPAYSTEGANLAAALVRAGLMQPDD